MLLVSGQRVGQTLQPVPRSAVAVDPGVSVVAAAAAAAVQVWVQLRKITVLRMGVVHTARVARASEEAKLQGVSP